MKRLDYLSRTLLMAGTALCAAGAFAQTPSATKPYEILNQTQTLGTGGIDYVFADSEERRLYIPRGGEIIVLDLDSLKSAGTIPNARAHGVAVDPQSHHGFSTSNPVVMWDTRSLAVIKTIEVKGGPDGLLFEPATERVYIFSHSAPNVTVLDGKDGSIVDTIDLGGAPEQAASDGQGHLYVDLEDRNKVAVVDVNTMKVTTTYDLADKGKTPAGLGLDAKNHILFVFCRNPAVAVIMSADDGKILTTLPIGTGTDGGGFNPNTMEAFSSQRDGTLTIIKETSPTAFEVAQTVQTKSGAKTCTLDSKKDRIVLIALEPVATPPTSPDGTAAAAPATNAPSGGGRRGGGRGGPAFLDVMVVGR